MRPWRVLAVLGLLLGAGMALAQVAAPPATDAAAPDDGVPAYPSYPQLGSPYGPQPEPGEPVPKTERLVTGMSTDAVGITAAFDGSDILIYGAVARDAPVPPGPPLDIIVTDEGPADTGMIHRKTRVLG